MPSKKVYNILLLIFILFLKGCDWSWDIDDDNGRNDSQYPLPSQTKILEIEIDPNPVIGGEDITFTCIIEDSLIPRYYYQWSLNLANNASLDSTIMENSLTIKSPELPGTYNGFIAVYYDLTERNTQPAFREFQYEVIEKPE